MSAYSDIVRRLGGSDIAAQIAEGAFSEVYQKDYAHASKLFRSDNLALAPRQKFLFHVFFSLRYPNMLEIPDNDQGMIGALVKSVQLPSFTLDTEEHIQYNRKRLVHNRIKYQPITITLHDDGMDFVRTMWAKYYQYHFEDPAYQYDEGLTKINQAPNGRTDYNGRDIYSDARINQAPGWGKTIRYGNEQGVKLPFFTDIKIYGFNRGHFASYTLINPVITSWVHDTYDYSQGNGIMQHTATIQYEAVKYGAGQVGDIVKGFADPSRYDTQPGTLGPGTTTSLYGAGGLIETIAGIDKDLANGNIGGVIKKVGTSARTFGSTSNLQNVVASDFTDKVISDTTQTIGELSKGSLQFPSVGNINKKPKTTTKPRSE